MLGQCYRRWPNIQPTLDETVGIFGYIWNSLITTFDNSNNIGVSISQTDIIICVYKFEELSISYDKPIWKCALKRSLCHVLITLFQFDFVFLYKSYIYEQTVPGIT